MKRRLNILLQTHESTSGGSWCWRDEWHVTGQSAFILFAKFQRLNALSFTALTQYVTRQDDRVTPLPQADLRDARQFDLGRMMCMLRLPLEDVAAAFVMPSYLCKNIAAGTLRWCPQCAKEGVHLTEFQFHSSVTCPIHRVSLVNRCPKCRSRITYRLQAEIFRMPFSCPSCSCPWIRPAGGLDDLRIGEAYRRQVFARAARVDCYRDGETTTHGFLLGGKHDVVVEQPENGWPVLQRGGRRSERTLIDGAALDEINREDAVLSEAYRHYKALRRAIMRVHGRQHRACIAEATRHFSWRLDGCTTTPFCPAAHAILRWRMKWEGIGVPNALIHPPVHGPLGIAVWLSLFAPIPDNQCNETDVRWMVLHAFDSACIDCFRSYYVEAAHARPRDRILWLPFPAQDFQRRDVSAAGNDRAFDPVRWTSLSETRQNGDACTGATRRIVHHLRHVRLLAKNKAPNNPFLDWLGKRNRS